MSKSIISNNKQCFFCNSIINIHKHHIFFGTANRKLSEKYGCWVYLCAHHHNMSDEGVHFNKAMDLELKQLCQKEMEKNGTTRTEFMQIFGRNYL